jgi:hypothetical protein
LIVAAFFLPRACHSHWVSFETGFMAYEVLARKYRSRTFDEIVGQKAIATTLKNAVESGRIHHGYLFTGTRGVGKTSMARILAKALNCFAFDAPTTTPCCACELCRRVSEGGDLDVVEIDAASNTGGGQHSRAAQQRGVQTGPGPLQGLHHRRSPHAQHRRV